jgi:hypothetical protein
MFRNLLHKLRKKPNTLDIIDVGVYGVYDVIKSKYTTIDKLKKKALYSSSIIHGVINTTYNNIKYPVYDLDSEDMLSTFKTEVKDDYVLFQSSPGRYWAILDIPLTKLSDYKTNINWNVINDNNYRHMCLSRGDCVVRFTYKTIERKPFIIKPYDNSFSDNFKEMIDKFENLIEEDGLEISTLIWKNTNLLNLFNTKNNRRNKLKKII